MGPGTLAPPQIGIGSSMDEAADTMKEMAPAAEDSGRAVATLVRVFREVFGTDEADPDSDFFELGGDSLMAASLMALIEREFGAVLSVSLLLEASTPKQLADVVSAAVAANRPRSLVTVNAEGSAAALFCVHGMMGSSLFPMRLANALNRERPVYGFRAIGLEHGEVPFESIPEMAAAYVRDLKTVQPTGPYLILGQCGPCFVAFEVAQQLRREGSEVAGLILGDPPGAEQIAWRNYDDPQTLETILHNAGARVRHAVERARNDPDLSTKARVNLVNNALSGVVGAYLPEPYPGPTLVIYSPRRGGRLLDPYRGLPRLLPNMTAVQVGEDHRAIFQSRVGDTAAAIKAFLDRLPIA
jgi:thioesterase domain-containing protein/acyl carrier protein